MPSLQTSDLIASGAAIVALFAMLATFWQVKIARDHNKLSVMPHLDAAFYAFPNEPFRITLFNNGLGPAIVRSFHLSVDDTEYSHVHPVPSDDLRKILEKSGHNLNLTIVGYGTPIRADAEITVVQSLAPPESAQQFTVFKAFGRRLGLRVVYASLYGDEREMRISFAEFG